MNNPLGKKISLINLIKFTMPTMLMMIFMAFYTMVDGIFVSNFVNTRALSAINIVFPILTVVIAISIMIATGGSAVIARQMGEGKDEKAKKNFSMFIYLGIIIGVVIEIIGFIFIKDILTFLGGKGDLFVYCYDYAHMLMYFIILAILQLLFQFFFLTAGKPHLALMATVVGGVANIVLDYIFIVKLNLGIQGAALATGIGFSIPAVFGLIYFTFNRKGSLYLVRPRWSGEIIARACINGSSEMVTNLSVAVTTFLFNYTTMKYLGENGVAAITIVLYSEYLLTAMFLGYSSGVAPLYSYNYGEKNEKGLKKLFSYSIGIVIIGSIITFIVANILSENIVGIFANHNPDVFKIGINGLKLFSFAFIFMGLNIFTSSLFTALSNGKISASLSFLRTFILISTMILLLPRLLGVNGIWLAVPVAEMISMLVAIVCIIKQNKKYSYFK